jgi:hypothetical protein
VRDWQGEKRAETQESEVQDDRGEAGADCQRMGVVQVQEVTRAQMVEDCC